MGKEARIIPDDAAEENADTPPTSDANSETLMIRGRVGIYPLGRVQPGSL